MSLINQVLKDLERRHAGTGEARGMARAVRTLPEDAPRRSRWIVLGLIVAGALGGGTWWYLSQPERRAAPPAPKAAAAPAPAVPQTEAAAPAPAVPSVVAPTANQPAAALVPRESTSAQATVSPLAPRVAQEKIAGSPQPLPAGPTASGPVSTGAQTPAKVAPAAAPAPAGSAGEPLRESAQPAAKATRKIRPKPAGSDSVSKRGLSGVQSAEYPEPDGSEAAPSIDKQVRAPSERERAEAEFRQGMGALQAGNAADGEDHLRAALAIDPLADKARQALLGLYVERNRREDAERLLEDRLRVDRKHPGFALALARLQLERGANGEALVTLQRSLPYGETSAEYQAMLANALARVGRHKEAAERYEAATRLAPRNPLWLMGMGVALRADNRPEEARAAFQRARELGGLNPQLASFVEQQLRELK
jgi:MSHA biogenesis protein MshN